MKDFGVIILVCILAYVGNYIVMENISTETVEYIISFSDDNQRNSDTLRQLSYQIKQYLKKEHNIFVPLFIILCLAAAGGYIAGCNKIISRKKESSQETEVKEVPKSQLISLLKKQDILYALSLSVCIASVFIGVLFWLALESEKYYYKYLIVFLLICGLLFFIISVYLRKRRTYIKVLLETSRVLELDEDITESLLSFIAKQKNRQAIERVLPIHHINADFNILIERIGKERIDDIWQTLHLDDIYITNDF